MTYASLTSGGALAGMSSLILDSISSIELDKLANNGDLRKTDLKIGDVVNEIGNLSNDVTAVNLGKLKRSDNFSDDIACELSHNHLETNGGSAPKFWSYFMQRNAKTHSAGVKADSINLMALTQFFKETRTILEKRGEYREAFYFEQLETNLREGGTLSSSPKDIARILGL